MPTARRTRTTIAGISARTHPVTTAIITITTTTAAVNRSTTSATSTTSITSSTSTTSTSMPLSSPVLRRAHATAARNHSTLCYFDQTIKRVGTRCRSSGTAQQTPTRRNHSVTNDMKELRKALRVDIQNLEETHNTKGHIARRRTPPMPSHSDDSRSGRDSGSSGGRRVGWEAKAAALAEMSWADSCDVKQ